MGTLAIYACHPSYLFRAATMSALGQKQTSQDFQPMSALPPKRTSELSGGMSALCQKRTHALQQFISVN
jgi:hypothetical protein